MVLCDHIMTELHSSSESNPQYSRKTTRNLEFFFSIIAWYNWKPLSILVHFSGPFVNVGKRTGHTMRSLAHSPPMYARTWVTTDFESSPNKVRKSSFAQLPAMEFPTTLTKLEQAGETLHIIRPFIHCILCVKCEKHILQHQQRFIYFLRGSNRSNFGFFILWIFRLDLKPHSHFILCSISLNWNFQQLVISVSFFGTSSVVPWLAALITDASSHTLLSSHAQNHAKSRFSETEQRELQRRTFIMLFYFLRSPIYDRYTK